MSAFSIDPKEHRAQSDARRQAGDELGALAHLIAAQTLESPERSPEPLLQVATGYFTKGDLALARCWYELVLRLDAAQPVAYQNLAAIHAQAGDEVAAAACRDRAYRLQRLFIETLPDAQRRLLILCVGHTSGNIPYEALLSRSPSTRLKYAIDYAGPEEDEQLPEFDIIFNAVGEPDVAVGLAERLAQFEDQWVGRRPLLNPSAAVQRTQRHRLPELLQGLPGVVAAACSRYDTGPGDTRELRHRLEAAGISLPALVRPVATHGGIGLGRCEDLPTLAAAIAQIDGAHYVSSYIDSRSADGFYRKYRVVFIDGEPHAYHLAISPQWMVHYFSADMLAHPWKLAEDERFTSDAVGVLGSEVFATLRAIGQRIGLDYAGIDFTLVPDQSGGSTPQVLVFEANATMLVHGERAAGPLAYRNQAIQGMADAFERMLERRAGELRT